MGVYTPCYLILLIAILTAKQVRAQLPCYVCEATDGDDCTETGTCGAGLSKCHTRVILDTDGNILFVRKSCSSDIGVCTTDFIGKWVCTSDDKSCQYCCNIFEGGWSPNCNADITQGSRDLVTIPAPTPDPTDSNPACYSCEDAPTAEICDQFDFKQCGAGKVCGTTVRRLAEGTFTVTKGCWNTDVCHNPDEWQNATNGLTTRYCCNGTLCNEGWLQPDGIRRPLSAEKAAVAQGGGEVANCRCWGDPHCRSFDSQHSTFQGTCTYLMARDGCTDGFPSAQPTFQVFADFFRPDENVDVSWGRDPIVLFDGHTIKMDSNGAVTIDGGDKIEDFPHEFTDGGSTLANFVQAGDDLIMVTNFNLTVKAILGGYITISLPRTDVFMNNVCGFCGNFDDDPNNDWRIGPFHDCLNSSSYGNQTLDVNIFGDSWNVADKLESLGCPTDDGCQNTTTCPPVPPSTADPCKDDPSKNAAQEICGDFDPDTATNTDFTTCLREMTAVDIKGFFRACRYDVCVTGNTTLGCTHLMNLEKLCAEQYGISLNDSWHEHHPDCL